MRSEPFTRTDGTTGTRFIPEAGDIVTAEFDAVAEKSHPAIKDKGSKNPKAITITSYFLGVSTGDGQKVTLKMTQGMKKALDKEGNIKGKQLKFEKYNHKQYGELLGVKIVK